MIRAIRSPKQPSSPISQLIRISELYSPHIRQLSNRAASSRTVEHNGKTDSLHPPNSNGLSDAATGIADVRTNAQLRKGNRWHRAWNRTITTLDPKHLDAGCFLNISGTTAPSIYTFFTEEEKEIPGSFQLWYCQQRHIDHSGKCKTIHQAFPDGTKGFLYFHGDAQKPLYSQLRFRITGNSDPANFSRGRDLVYDKGYLWYLSVKSLMSRPSHPVVRLLLRDRLISATLALDSQCSKALRFSRVRRLISSLDEPFVLDISLLYTAMIVYAAGKEYRFQFLPHAAYVEGRPVRLYDEGSALCRFERSILPEHIGKHIIVMRLLKMLDPPKFVPDPPPTVNAMLPEEGELFSRRGHVWHMDLDKETNMARILRLLYDADDGHTDSHVGQ